MVSLWVQTLLFLWRRRETLRGYISPGWTKDWICRGETPVIPIYFYRLLGVEGEEENDFNIYINELFRLDEQLSAYGRYVRFDGSILTPQNNEMSYFKNFIGKSLTQDPTALRKQGLSLFLIHVFSMGIIIMLLFIKPFYRFLIYFLKMNPSSIHQK